jgi:hypothetical protein
VTECCDIILGVVVADPSLHYDVGGGNNISRASSVQKTGTMPMAE